MTRPDADQRCDSSFPGQTFCHTLHIMDSRGNSVLVNKKCATEIECQASKVGCVHIDTQLVSIPGRGRRRRRLNNANRSVGRGGISIFSRLLRCVSFEIFNRFGIRFERALLAVI